MYTSVNKFEDTKNRIRNLIANNLYREVTSQSKFNVSGIYIMYVDQCESKDIIPIYIGKSNNIQKRYKNHYTELLSLNRLSYEEYEKYFFGRNNSFFEGSFKTSKIFKYMIEHKCSLNDFHMIIIDEVEEELLNEKEQHYFSEYLPSIFGFNQLNTLLSGFEIRYKKREKLSNQKIIEFLKIINEDLYNIEEYYHFGFTRFNFEHSMLRSLEFLKEKSEFISAEVIMKLKETEDNLEKMLKKYIPDFEKNKEIDRDISIKYKDFIEKKDKLEESKIVFSDKTKKVLRKYRIYSEKAKNNFMNGIYKENINRKKAFLEYLQKREIEIDFYDLLKEEIIEYLEAYKEVIELKEIYEKAPRVDDRKYRQERYKLIFPTTYFDSFPLKDNNQNSKMLSNYDFYLNNTCHIKIYLSSNNRLTGDIEKLLFIFRVDYTYYDENNDKKEYKKYIENEITLDALKGNMYICPDFYNLMVVRRDRFKVTRLVENRWDNTFISILSEFKHGLNDYSIQGQELHKLGNVLEHIQSIVNDNTRYDVRATESFPTLSIGVRADVSDFNTFIEKLVSNKLPKLKKTGKTFF